MTDDLEFHCSDCKNVIPRLTNSKFVMLTHMRFDGPKGSGVSYRTIFYICDECWKSIAPEHYQDPENLKYTTL